MEGNGGGADVCVWGGGVTEKLRSEAEEEWYQRSFVACVDKYAKMSSLRDLDVWVF